MSVSNLYHILSFMPAVEAWEMPPALERLAQRLVQSGRLRIATDIERNFVHLSTSDTDKTFSSRELTDPALAAPTRAELARHVPRGLGAQGVQDKIEQLALDLKKGRGVLAEKEMKVARVLVQSIDAGVVELLLETGTEIFVSYSHNVAELMAMRFWETLGESSGLQSTADTGAAIYISCGGDPFFEGEAKTFTTDGFPALARMVAIGGQELGHFADLIHTKDGAIRGRYSTDNASRTLRASPVARGARGADMRRVDALRNELIAAGLGLLLRAERSLAFYDKRLRFSPPWLFYQCFRSIAWLNFRLRAGGRLILRTIPRQHCATALDLFLADMRFNLAPDAEVYRRPDPEEEEAIACIEALARVPQQANKWGMGPVRMAWPELSRIYEGMVIPGTYAALQQAPIIKKITFIQYFTVKARKVLRKRPGYYPEPV